MEAKLSAQMENYLEIIHVLEQEHGHAHVRDIAYKLGVKPPSANEALNRLKEEKYLKYPKYGYVTLTNKGKEVSGKVYRSHRVLFNFLHNTLGIAKAIAQEDACKIEHIVHPATIKKLRKFSESVKG